MALLSMLWGFKITWVSFKLSPHGDGRSEFHLTKHAADDQFHFLILNTKINFCSTIPENFRNGQLREEKYSA